MDVAGGEDMAKHVDDLDDAISVDDDIAVGVDEGEVIVAFSASGEHQLEAAGIIRHFGFEGVALGFEQVDVVAGEVVDQVEVAES